MRLVGISGRELVMEDGERLPLPPGVEIDGDRLTVAANGEKHGVILRPGTERRFVGYAVDAMNQLLLETKT